MQNLLFEISKSFEEITNKEIILELEKAPKEINIQRSPEVTYGIRNFVGNAVKFSKKKVKIILIQEEKEILISIHDDGPGFPEDIFNIIGEPYILSRSKTFKRT